MFLDARETLPLDRVFPLCYSLLTGDRVSKETTEKRARKSGGEPQPKQMGMLFGSGSESFQRKLWKRCMRRVRDTVSRELKRQGLSSLPDRVPVAWDDIVRMLGPCPGKMRHGKEWRLVFIISPSRLDLRNPKHCRAAFLPVNFRWMKADQVSHWEGMSGGVDIKDLIDALGEAREEGPLAEIPGLQPLVGGGLLVEEKGSR